MQIKILSPDKINPAGYNPRKISDKDFDHLKASLEKFGFVDPLIINKRTDLLVGGHQRLKAATALGMTEIPVTYIDVSEADEKELNVRLNRNTGEFDLGKLNEFFGEQDLLSWGFESYEVGIKDEDYLAEVDLPEGTFSEPDSQKFGAELSLLLSPEVKDNFLKLLGAIKKKHGLENQESAIQFIIETLVP